MLCNERIKNHRRSIDKIKKCVGGMALLALVELTIRKSLRPALTFLFWKGWNWSSATKRISKHWQRNGRNFAGVKRVQKIYSSLTGYEEKIYYNRVILKETQQRTAEKIGLSVRQEQRIEGDMKDRGLIWKWIFFETKIFQKFEPVFERPKVRKTQ